MFIAVTDFGFLRIFFAVVLLFPGDGFGGSYEEYYGLTVDTESLVYLMLANYMLHHFYPFVITIAEVEWDIRRVKIL